MKKTLLALMMAFSMLIGISTAQAQIIHDISVLNATPFESRLDMTGTGGITIDGTSGIETTALGAVITMDTTLLENTAITDVTSYVLLSQNGGDVESIANFIDDTSFAATDSSISTTVMGSVIEVTLQDQNTPLAASLDITAENDSATNNALTNITAPLINFTGATLNTLSIGANVGVIAVSHGVQSP